MKLTMEVIVSYNDVVKPVSGGWMSPKDAYFFITRLACLSGFTGAKVIPRYDGLVIPDSTFTIEHSRQIVERFVGFFPGAGK